MEGDGFATEIRHDDATGSDDPGTPTQQASTRRLQLNVYKVEDATVPKSITYGEGGHFGHCALPHNIPFQKVQQNIR